MPTLNLIKKLKIEIMTETKQKDEKVFANVKCKVSWLPDKSYIVIDLNKY